MAFGKSSRREIRFTVYIPARYTVQPSRAERVVPIVCCALFVFLWFVLLREFLAWGGPPAHLLAILALAGLAAACPLWAVGARKTQLEVEGENLVYRGWLRPERRFTFSDIGFVQTRQGRESVALWAREGWMICRLHVTMDGLDTLLADLRSRGALLAAQKPRNRDGPPPLRSPGPRKEEVVLDLPGQVPDCYCLQNPGLYSLVFLPCAVFCGALGLWSLADGERLVPLCFFVFALGALGALILIWREKIVCLGDRFRCQPLRGKAYEVRFEDVAAAKLKTVSTGIGSISSIQLLDREGKPVVSPGAGMKGLDILLADMIRRGVPFTY